MSIKNLEKILEHRINKNAKIIDTKITNLVGPGENYGGELLKLEIITEDETTKVRNVEHVVAKKIPALAILQKHFNIQVTFKAEILFYEKIVPILQNFQKENGIEDVIDCFLKVYAARINLNGSDVVDEDGVIVMENLITSGYKNLDRHIGYNSEETKMVLKDLANLHSTVLALKLRKPDFFQKEIRPLCCNTMVGGEEGRFSKIMSVVGDILLESEKTAPYVPKVMEIWEKYGDKFGFYKPREPFATISHCDLWVNNAMMKYVNGKPIKNIFLDFQLYSYQSPVFDLLNFLVTSVQTKVIKKEFDDFIKFYHTEFVKNLERLGCDLEPFSMPKFEKELLIDCEVVVAWAILFIPFVIFGEKRDGKEEVKPTDFQSEETINKIRSMMPECRERLYFMVETFGNKGWLI